MQIEDNERIATVNDLIEHLEKNFNPRDKLCFFDYVGARRELVHIPCDFIGDKRWMFNKVKDTKTDELESYDVGIVNERYRLVDDEDVLIW